MPAEPRGSGGQDDGGDHPGHRGVMLLLFRVLEGTKPSGDPPGLQPPHLAGTAWSCPHVRITCARPNPPNTCDSSRQCPRHQKCCQGACGRRCLSCSEHQPQPLALSLSLSPA
uniref:WAP domain-containing protein n=1 Tax=Anser cygnoides TaxID=8845 RepID=A0A8B9INY9_ANSCY